LNVIGGFMGATLRTSMIRVRRSRQEKRRKLKQQLAQASGAERAAVEAKLQKTYRFLTAELQAAKSRRP
jgi:hypothetical protein